MSSDSSEDANRDPGASSPTHGLATPNRETASFDLGRSVAVGLPIACLDAMALSFGPRQTGDGDRLAAKGFSALLDMEE